MPNDRKIKEVYDKIAESFYKLRQYPITPEINKLAEEWEPGKLLDIGCGIGNSMFPFVKRVFDCVGLDISTKQLSFAKEYAKKNDVEFKLVAGYMLSLPFESEFDYVISIAALHHLDSEEKRLKALSEMKRVLKPNGEIFFTVWNQRASLKYEKQVSPASIFLGTSHQKKHDSPISLKNDKDIYIPWKIGEKEYYRYYYFFEKDELRQLIEDVGFKKIKVYEDKEGKNLCVRAKVL